ncbi:hypothetical protein [Tolypothrix sp. NIES-4075]|uniref:hypothetical protein n=1 Tax=Tolypothrix sp. NIES-4075 TaxID=2005459 RepID=UPI000B5CB559|nr:hypothetical protein [Tolypothrix sp. NIES-4075]
MSLFRGISADIAKSDRSFQANCKAFSYEARSPVVVLRRNGYSSITSAGNDCEQMVLINSSSLWNETALPIPPSDLAD